jgi:hypothetical protein
MQRRLPYALLTIIIVMLSSCSSPAASPTSSPTGAAAAAISSMPAPTITNTATASSTPPPTATFTPTRTPTSTLTPSLTHTPTQTFTPSITPSPTYSLPTLTVKMQSNCRYGPAVAYLYAWGMYAGDTATVWGRNESGTWLWIQPDNIHYQCWIAASLVDVVGDIFSVYVASVRLPHSVLYGPPNGVSAVRDGDSVTVSWNRVNMTEDDDRGYMIEANLCQAGKMVWTAVATMDTSYTFTDGTSCSEPSNGLLYTVEKHGYTDPVTIPWP